MDAEEVTDEALMNKKKKTEPVAKKVNQQQDNDGAAGPTGRQAGQEDNVENEH